MKSDKPVECVGCNTFDVGSIIDNSERDAKFEKVYETQAEAEQALVKLTQKHVTRKVNRVKSPAKLKR